MELFKGIKLDKKRFAQDINLFKPKVRKKYSNKILKKEF